MHAKLCNILFVSPEWILNEIVGLKLTYFFVYMVLHCCIERENPNSGSEDQKYMS